MKLEGKCVKVIDSDITKDTCWSKCYSYVITKDIHVLNNVKLTIQDNTGLYLLNGKFDNDINEYNGGGIIFDSGSELCAGNLSVLAVALDDEKYVITTEISDNFDNNGIKFFGTKQELEWLETYNSKNLSKSNKAKLHRKKIYELKKNMVKSNQSSKFVFKSLTLEYCQGIILIDVDSKEFYGKNITIFNSFVGRSSYYSPFNLSNAHISLDNLIILSNKPKFQNFLTNISLDSSTLNINKSLNVSGGEYFLQNTADLDFKSYIILNKCSKILIELAYFNGYGEITIEPRGLLTNQNNVPYLVDKCLKEKVVITSSNPTN